MSSVKQELERTIKTFNAKLDALEAKYNPQGHARAHPRPPLSPGYQRALRGPWSEIK